MLRSNRPEKEQALPGFEDIQRFWDNDHKSYTAKILPGEYYVTKNNESIVTVLGSCVSACIRDRLAGIGGMNHFMLPASKGTEADKNLSDATRYGNYAMEHMINSILANGGKRTNLEVKIFGGGRMLETSTNVGWCNIGFIYDYIFTEQLRIDAQDVGDIYPRRVLYFPKTGKVKVKKLKSMHDNKAVEQEENSYAKNMTEKPVADDIELF